MTAILIAWAVSAVALLLLAAGLSTLVKITNGPLGILIDNRGRFSLNHLQLVVWSVVIISLVAGVFFGRLIEGVGDPLNFTIPDEVLGLLGISVGSSVTAGVVKATKNRTAARQLATFTNTNNRPFFGQVFMLEEGDYADEVVDVTKFQSFGFTIVLVVAYVAMAIQAIVDAGRADNVTALPGLSGTFLVLLGISYAGYVGGKIPAQTRSPQPGAAAVGAAPAAPRAAAAARAVAAAAAAAVPAVPPASPSAAAAATAVADAARAAASAATASD